MKNSKTLNMKMPAKLYDDIKFEAEKKNVSLASIVRLACTEYLNREENKNKELIF